MIQIQNLTKRFSSTHGLIKALDNINLDIQAGEIFGIIGRSGAGKSTLLRCVNLLESPSEGSVLIEGQDLTTLSKTALNRTRQSIGMIFQHFNLLNAKTIYENVALPLRLRHMPEQQIQQRVTELLNLVELQDKRSAYPAHLSGGQKQRVAIARALANESKVLLCDEATSALDPQTTQSILHLLKSINQQLNLTILLITHEMDVVKQICDRLAVMDAGKIIECGSTYDLFRHPKMTLTQEFVRQSLQDELPDDLIHQLLPSTDHNQSRIVRFHFFDRSSQEPLISTLMEKFSVKLNILHANINYVQQHSMGTMIVEVDANAPGWTDAATFLQNSNVEIEELGYVSQHA